VSISGLLNQGLKKREELGRSVSLQAFSYSFKPNHKIVIPYYRVAEYKYIAMII
jgi:hypothetical protein